MICFISNVKCAVDCLVPDVCVMTVHILYTTDFDLIYKNTKMGLVTTFLTLKNQV